MTQRTAYSATAMKRLSNATLTFSLALFVSAASLALLAAATVLTTHLLHGVDFINHLGF